MNAITRKFKTWMTLPLAAAFAISLPLAQAGDKQEKREKDRASASYEKKDKKHKDYKNKSQGQRSASYQKALKGSTLEGMDLIGENGETIASVDDVIIDLTSGKMTAVIASTGFLGFGGEEKRVDVKDLDPQSLADRNVRTTLSNREFEDLKPFDESEVEQRASNKQLRQGEIRGMSLRGQNIQGPDGGHVGEFDDWIVSLEEGAAPYLILRKAPLDPFEYRFDYLAVSTDEVRGLNENSDLVVGVSDDALADAESIGDRTDLLARDAAEVYIFKYEPDSERTSSASQRMDD